MKTRKTRPFRELLTEQLSDPEVASLYLNAALEESKEEFLVAMKEVAKASQMAIIAKKSGIQRETLYRSLSEQGNPTLDTLLSILSVMGMKIVTAPAKVKKYRKTLNSGSALQGFSSSDQPKVSGLNISPGTKLDTEGMLGFDIHNAGLSNGFAGARL